MTESEPPPPPAPPPPEDGLPPSLFSSLLGDEDDEMDEMDATSMWLRHEDQASECRHDEDEAQQGGVDWQERYYQLEMALHRFRDHATRMREALQGKVAELEQKLSEAERRAEEAEQRKDIMMAAEPICMCCGSYLTEPYIRCTECKDPARSFCLKCFAKGREYESHKNTHGYVTVVNNFPLFEKSWLAYEELKLLDAISQCGIGNWASIAKIVGTKTKAECEQHYYTHYINSCKPPLPKLPDPVIECETHAAPVLYTVSQEPPRPAAFSPIYNEMAGYMPARGDFCSEFDDYAELDVKEIEFKDDDDPVFTELQMAVLNNYRFRLQRRAWRKLLMKKFGLISRSENVEEWKRYQVLGKNVVDKLKPLMRLMSPKKFDQFMEGILSEERLKQQITLLQECRSAGILQLQAVATYVKLKAKRDSEHRSKSMLDKVLVHIKDEKSRSNFIRKQALGAPSTSSSCRNVPPMVINNLPRYEELLPKERELCANLRLYPDSYLRHKANLIHEYHKLGSLKLANARTVLKIDVNKTRKIFDLLVEEGFINK